MLGKLSASGSIQKPSTIEFDSLYLIANFLAVGGQEIRHGFAVADLVGPAILGLGFLKANHVDICGADIWINGQRIGCFSQKDGVGF